MLHEDIEILQNFLKTNYNISNMGIDEKSKFKYFNEEIAKLKDKIPSIEKLEELKGIEVELETKFEELYELGNYFDPVFIKIKKNIHEESVLKIREKNRKKGKKNVGTNAMVPAGSPGRGVYGAGGPVPESHGRNDGRLRALWPHCHCL